MRVVERNMSDGPAHGADVSAEVVRSVAELDTSAGVSTGGGVLAELGGIAVQAASVGGITQRGLVGGEGVACRCGPEAWRREPALPVVPAVLVEVIRELVQRPGRDAGQPLIAAPGAGSGGAGAGRARADAGEWPADAFWRA